MGDNSEVIRRYREAVEANDMVTMTALLDDFATDDFVQEWPQSGERLRVEGSKKMAEQYSEATGTRPTMKLGDIRESGDLAVVEGTIDYSNEYFADPFEAPAWRAPFVERMAAAGDVA